jgi:DNA-binding beta-propeller fold protein YncE
LLFVTDYGNHRVQVFDAINGEFVHIIGSTGGYGPGQFNGPLGLSLHQSLTGGATLLFVGDNGNNRVQVFNAITGTYIREIGTGGGTHPGQFNGIYGLCVQPANTKSNGMLYVADFSNHRIQKFDAVTGELVRIYGTGVGNQLENLCFPSDVCVHTRADGAAVLYVAEQNNSRVQVFVINE